MKLVNIAFVALLLVSSVSATAAPANLIFQKGRVISGTCFAKLRGAPLMNGACSGLGHGNSLFVTAEKDGCSLEIIRSGRGAISAYKNECGNLDSSDTPIGTFKPVGNCLVAPAAKVCLKAGREVFKEAY